MPSWSKRSLFFGVSFLSLAAMLLTVQIAFDWISTHPLFLVKTIDAIWPDGVDGQPKQFQVHPPVSIFRLDLVDLAEAFQRRYPAIRVEEIRRILPNRLVARMRFRKVVAQMEDGGRYFMVSEDGVIVSQGQPHPLASLPIFKVRGKVPPLSIGAHLDTAFFWKALPLLSILERSGGRLAGYRVVSVQLEGDSLMVDLEGAAQLRFASDELAQCWQRLIHLFVSKPQILDQALYLDLRFDEPVVRERDWKGQRGVRPAMEAR